jgi:ISXO2-like transposase domain/Transposase zinc-ribbon domain
MARNTVQFQKGLSEAEFQKLYGTEDLCRAVVFDLRWPDGFVCPACQGRAHCVLATRTLYQCNACKRQTSLTAGTIFAATKLELTVWFRAMYHMTQSKQGISSVELGRRLGVRQRIAWAMKSKLAQVMLEREDHPDKRLTGRVEMDDAYLGGERSGGKRGRGAPAKKPFVVAVQTTSDGKPHKVKLRRVKRFTKRAVKALAEKTLLPTAEVYTDGLGCFRGVAAAGATHRPLTIGPLLNSAKMPRFKWVNTVLGNIKSAITGTYRAVRSHADRTLAEFEYRFNRRYDLAAMMPRLAYAAVRTQPMPYRLLISAEGRG